MSDVKLIHFNDLVLFMSVFIKCGRIRWLEGEEACTKLSAVKWSGKTNFCQGKVSEKSGNFISYLEWAPCWYIYMKRHIDINQHLSMCRVQKP